MQTNIGMNEWLEVGTNFWNRIRYLLILHIFWLHSQEKCNTHQPPRIGTENLNDTE